MNSTDCYCSFCASLGIKGPHDHWLRASRKAGGATCCPNLLATVCNFCKRKGHTIKFCGEYQDQERQRRSALTIAKKKACDRGDWMTSAPGRKVIKPLQVVQPKVDNTMVGMFAALDMEECSSSDEEQQMAPEEPQVKSTAWADVVKKRSVAFDVPERPTLKTAISPRATPALVQDDSDDELPPLIFGKRSTTRWADEV